MSVIEANRETLKRHVRAMADIAILFVEMLPVVSRRVSNGGSAIRPHSLDRLLSRLERCATHMENWIFAPAWNDRELLPPLVAGIGKTAVQIHRWSEAVETQETGFADDVVRACRALAADLEAVAERLEAYEKSLDNGRTLRRLDEIPLELAVYHDLLEALPPSVEA